jgi:hypothetical protein
MPKKLKAHAASFKFKVVLESFTSNNVAETARKYSLNANQLSRLSKLFPGTRTQLVSNGCDQARTGAGETDRHAGTDAGQKRTGDPALKKILGFLRPARWQLAQYARALVAQGEAGVNQICQLMGKSREDLLPESGATRTLGAEVPGAASSAGSAHRKAPELWHPTAEESAGRTGRSRRQCETAAQAPARLGTHLASHGRGRPAQEDLGATGHRLDFDQEPISFVTSRSRPVSRCW